MAVAVTMTAREEALGWAFSARCWAIRGGAFARMHSEACLAAGEGRECAAELRAMLDSPMQWPAVSRWLVMRSPWLADLLHVPANAELDSDAGRARMRTLYAQVLGERPRHASGLHAVAWLEAQR